MISKFSEKGTRAFHSAFKAYRCFSSHCKIAVVGGGAAGIDVTAQLIKDAGFKSEDITLFEPRKEHHYQPGYTMIGGGLLGTTPDAVKKKESSHIKRPMKDMIPKGVNHKSEYVKTFDPDNNSISTDNDTYTYDYLVV